MPILSYTTSIAVEKTAGEIQKKLIQAGARAVLFEYDDDGLMDAVSFRIQDSGRELNFRLPSNRSGVFHALQEDPRVPNRLKTHEQASRVTWRIIKHWVEAQLAIIEAEVADLKEVFLPYVQSIKTGKTLYEVMEDSQYKLLEQGG